MTPNDWLGLISKIIMILSGVCGAAIWLISGILKRIKDKIVDQTQYASLKRDLDKLSKDFEDHRKDFQNYKDNHHGD